MPRKHPRWSAHLARPIAVKHGATLRILHDARAFVLGLPEGVQLRQSWQKAAELLIAAANGNGDIDAATRQIEVALFLEAQLGPSKIPDNLDAVDYASQLVALSHLRLMLSAQYRFAAPTGNAPANCKYP